MLSQPRRPQSSSRRQSPSHRHGPACLWQRRYELEHAILATHLVIRRAELGGFRREVRSARRLAASFGHRLERLEASAGDGRP